MNFPVALEGALKLKEISYIHAEGYPAAEMKHGPIALIDEKMPVVFVVPKDSIYEKVISNVQEVRARKGRIIAIANDFFKPGKEVNTESRKRMHFQLSNHHDLGIPTVRWHKRLEARSEENQMELLIMKPSNPKLRHFMSF